MPVLLQSAWRLSLVATGSATHAALHAGHSQCRILLLYTIEMASWEGVSHMPRAELSIMEASSSWSRNVVISVMMLMVLATGEAVRNLTGTSINQWRHSVGIGPGRQRYPWRTACWRLLGRMRWVAHQCENVSNPFYDVVIKYLLYLRYLYKLWSAIAFLQFCLALMYCYHCGCDWLSAICTDNDISDRVNKYCKCSAVQHNWGV